MAVSGGDDSKDNLCVLVAAASSTYVTTTAPGATAATATATVITGTTAATPVHLCATDVEFTKTPQRHDIATGHSTRYYALLHCLCAAALCPLAVPVLYY
eukprot:Lankesteria_metandrocarpae@DN3663_c0_g1_i1.p2